MFASSSRLDINIVVGPKRPGNIKTILSGHLPIIIDYWHLHGPKDASHSALWRMRAALKHRDRVREISLQGRGNFFRKFIRATSYHFPALESLIISFRYGLREPDIPATFLRGPGQSDLPVSLRSLELDGASLASISGLLSTLSATALTDLKLTFTSHFDSSQGSSFLAWLQGMQCLRSLCLVTPNRLRDYQSQHSTPKDIVPLSNLTYFRYSGSTAFLNDLMSGLSTPSLQDARFKPCFKSPFLYLSWAIDDVREEFSSVRVTFVQGQDIGFRFLASSHSEKIDRIKPSFTLNVHCLQNLIDDGSRPSTKLAMTEELTLIFPLQHITPWRNVSSLREFLRQFCSAKVLRVNRFLQEVGLYLQQDEGIMPVLEEIEVSISRFTDDSDEEYQRRAAFTLAAFEPLVSTRERAGRIIKVYPCPRVVLYPFNSILCFSPRQPLFGPTYSSHLASEPPVITCFR